MKVGIQSRWWDYNVNRNIAYLVKGIDYVRVYDAYEIFRKVCRAATAVTELFGVSLQDLRGKFFDLGINRVELLHFFNVVSFGNTPWVSTFETVLPRYQITMTCHHGRHPDYAVLKYDAKVRRAIDAMSRPACKNIIAISNCNARIQKEMLRLYPEYREAIENKMLVLHPPQVAFFQVYKAKRLSEDGPIRFMFVGGAFFRKGGMEMLYAFQRLRNDGVDLTLTIVSSLVIDDYATRETSLDVDRAKGIIDENREWISYHRSLSNGEVLDLMKASHIGLLPTYADTYGYSVLEFQACGCPVITTDVRALPEINDDRSGWIIKLPKNCMGEAIYTSDQDRSEIANAITSGIIAIVRDIVQNRAVIQLKADAALERIRVEHSPERHVERLREIYEGAFVNADRLAGQV
jgi:glycosyltransferase involved in cell wall biosynthesis